MKCFTHARSMAAGKHKHWLTPVHVDPALVTKLRPFVLNANHLLLHTACHLCLPVNVCRYPVIACILHVQAISCLQTNHLHLAINYWY